MEADDDGVLFHAEDFAPTINGEGALDPRRNLEESFPNFYRPRPSEFIADDCPYRGARSLR
jgi:hypothetical protein